MTRPADWSVECGSAESVVDTGVLLGDSWFGGRSAYFKATGFPDASVTCDQAFSMAPMTLSGIGT